MVDMGKIKDRCPTCGNDTLFISDGGWLTCSWLECKQPGVGRRIEQLLTIEKRVADIDAKLAAVVALTRMQDVPTRTNAVGQHYLHAPAEPPGTIKMVDATSHQSPPDTVSVPAEPLRGLRSDGHPRCLNTLNGEQCTGIRYHDASMNATPHTFNAVIV
jgi:hypothetical protein